MIRIRSFTAATRECRAARATTTGSRRASHCRRCPGESGTCTVRCGFWRRAREAFAPPPERASEHRELPERPRRLRRAARGHAPLEVEQRLLALEAAAVARQAPVGPD